MLLARELNTWEKTTNGNKRFLQKGKDDCLVSGCYEYARDCSVKRWRGVNFRGTKFSTSEGGVDEILSLPRRGVG